ncbi:Hypothetical predicted protein, partial [Paramuricea clavata]
MKTSGLQPYQGEPIADPAWIAQYNEERRAEKERRQLLMSRLNETVPVSNCSSCRPTTIHVQNAQPQLLCPINRLLGALVGVVRQRQLSLTTTLPAVAPVNFATTSTGPSSAISPALLEQIVSTVTAEVTRRLTPLSQPELSGEVIEAPVVTTTSTSTVPRLPGSAVVEQALHSAHSAIT